MIEISNILAYLWTNMCDSLCLVFGAIQCKSSLTGKGILLYEKVCLNSGIPNLFKECVMYTTAAPHAHHKHLFVSFKYGLSTWPSSYSTTMPSVTTSSFSFWVAAFFASANHWVLTHDPGFHLEWVFYLDRHPSTSPPLLMHHQP